MSSNILTYFNKKYDIKNSRITKTEINNREINDREINNREINNINKIYINIYDSQNECIYNLHYDKDYLYVLNLYINTYKIYYKQTLLTITNCKKHSKYSKYSKNSKDSKHTKDSHDLSFNIIYLNKDNMVSYYFMESFSIHYKYSLFYNTPYLIKHWIMYNKSLNKFLFGYIYYLQHKYIKKIYNEPVKYYKSIIFISNKYELEYYSKLFSLLIDYLVQN